MADGFGVRRTKVEAYMGLALLHGFGDDPRGSRRLRERYRDRRGGAARPRVGHPGGIERQPDAVLERFAARTSNADANVGQLGLSVTLH